ncbi:FecCD family ABC transporter permease [Vibrio nigripulchritudo]|uniref:FecCD family ABC transporter permease n=1 Tax=Vibrio nigripulchritudo TaxID=28173 RepID=UPI0024908C3A|nr:iron ABC transporter permease [Vibrio nigripulchritudo]BDU36317.1 iron(3+)-hydroxamate import system permease protein FhuG [Vibrio nigripulchritudo]BDU41974.1 iron(3+)-hydroxamate import system permease protein FhuG [Vibrio nigripulchritudo]
MITDTLSGQRAFNVFGFEVKLHNFAAMLTLAILTLCAMAWSISLGSIDTSFWNVFEALLGINNSVDQQWAIYDVRLPRLILAIMAGAAIALTGAMLQSLTQNPLADPGLLGLSQGSMIIIMILMVFFPGIDRAYYPFAAMLGGLAVGFFILSLTGRHFSGGIAILLMGIAVESALSSITLIILLYTPSEVSYSLGIWLNGSLFLSNWQAILDFLPWIILGLLIMIFAAKPLSILELGSLRARTLGSATEVSKPLILIGSVLISAASVTAVGPLAFLGVLAPQLAAIVSRATGFTRLVLAAQMGGLILILADTLTRVLISTAYMPVGLTIIIIGAPIFIICLRIRLLNQTR